MSAAVEQGRLTASRDAPVGGQAVLEGVMMRGVGAWAVAVRPPDAPDEIEVHSFVLRSALARHRWMRVPVLRGVIALGESLRLGFRALNIAVNAQMAHDEEEISGRMWLLALVAGVALAVTLFFVVPVTIASLFRDELGSATLFWLVEGLLRTTIFLGYLALLSRLRDLRRL